MPAISFAQLPSDQTPGIVVPMQALLEPFFAMLADPNVAYVLLVLGFLGLFLEFSAPGTSIPGAIGVLCLGLAAIGLAQLPFDWRGGMLIAIAFVLLLADIFVPSLGLLTVGGLALLIVGSYVLFDPAQGVFVNRALIWTLAIAMAALFAAIGGFALSVLRRKPATGREGIIGAVGTVRKALDPDGMVFVTGELWMATAPGGSVAAAPPIPVREAVTVTGIDGLRILVRRATAEELATAGVAVSGDRRPMPIEQDRQAVSAP